MEGWQTILLTALVTTVGTGLVTFIGHRLTVRSDTEAERKRHARYLAIRVVCNLDTFVSECGDVVYDDGMLGTNDEMTPSVPTPSLTLPEDVDWRAVDPDLMYRILGFSNEIKSADQAIAFVGDQIAGPPHYEEYYTERQLRYGQLGLVALTLADDLRARYGIPPWRYENWNPRVTLTKSVDKAKRAKAADEAENRRAFQEMEQRFGSSKPSQPGQADKGET